MADLAAPGCDEPQGSRNGRSIAFVGSAIPPAELAEHPSASVAGNRFQFGLLRALANIVPEGIQTYSVPPHAMWRGTGRVLSRKRRSEPAEGLTLTTVPFVNLMALKQISIFVSLLVQLTWWSCRERRRVRSIVVYNTISYLRTSHRRGSTHTQPTPCDCSRCALAYASAQPHQVYGVRGRNVVVA